MMHAKTDSDATSIAPSSPTRSPRRPVYYVQSPSRDSHDGEKTTTASFHSTPAVLSPSASPPHSHSSLGRDSSSTRFSASLKHSKITPDGSSRPLRSSKPWKRCDVIEEEGLLDDPEDPSPIGSIPRRCFFPLFVLSFTLLFSFFAVVLWAASRSQPPRFSVKSITFENFAVSAGTDASLVPTDLATLNSTVRMSFRNTGAFFGVHVSSTPIELSFYGLSLATGSVKEFYQSRKSQRNLSVVVYGNKIPLYGGASSLSAPVAGAKNGAAPPVPMTMGFTVRSRAYVLGRLVKTKFYTRVQCSVEMDLRKLNKPISLKNSCQIH